MFGDMKYCINGKVVTPQEHILYKLKKQKETAEFRVKREQEKLKQIEAEIDNFNRKVNPAEFSQKN